MTVYVLLVTLFLSNGTVIIEAVVGHSKEACQLAINPIAIHMLGKKYKIGMEEDTVIDVQGQCVAVTKSEHA